MISRKIRRRMLMGLKAQNSPTTQPMNTEKIVREQVLLAQKEQKE